MPNTIPPGSHSYHNVITYLRLICGVGFGPNGSTSGYTPASYITYSEEEKHFCAHEAKVVVDAPASVCFGLWDDWHRIVDYIDLVAQVRGNPRHHARQVAVSLVSLQYHQIIRGHGMLIVTCPSADRPGPQRAKHGAVSVLLSMG